MPARTSSIFKDNVRICKEVLSEPYSKLAAFKDFTDQHSCPEDMEPCNSKAHVTTCARPELKHLDCPITDIRLVRKADYNAQDHASYDIADAPEDLDWYLLQSRTAEDFLPLATFHLSEFEPCSLDDSFSSDNAGTENHGRTRDPYFDRCPLQPLES